MYKVNVIQNKADDALDQMIHKKKETMQSLCFLHILKRYPSFITLSSYFVTLFLFKDKYLIERFQIFNQHFKPH